MTERNVQTQAFQHLCYASLDFSTNSSGPVEFHLPGRQLPTLSRVHWILLNKRQLSYKPFRILRLQCLSQSLSGLKVMIAIY